MTDFEFVKTLEKAVEGDTYSSFKIMDLYENKIRKESYIDGEIDLDCVSYIKEKLLVEIRKFKNFK